MKRTARRGSGLFLLVLAILLLLVTWVSLAIGPIPITPLDVLRDALSSFGFGTRHEGVFGAIQVFWQIRLPRTLAAILIGTLLSLCGVAMQGLFRNPLADPGLIGVSGGAAVGAAAVIVLGASAWQLPWLLEPQALVVAAFAGGLLATVLVYRLGRRNGRTHVATMLLAGVALTALCGAIIGVFTYLADDGTLRKLTFWNLGSLNGVGYDALRPLLLVTLLLLLFLPRRARALNALLLGESEARHLGFDVEALKRELILWTALGVGAAVATAGLIGFVGLVVPHLMRLLVGPDHRWLLPASALAGAILLLLADVLARVVLAPAELPIGTVTALLGAPFFIYLLLRRGLHD